MHRIWDSFCQAKVKAGIMRDIGIQALNKESKGCPQKKAGFETWLSWVAFPFLLTMGHSGLSTLKYPHVPFVDI